MFLRPFSEQYKILCKTQYEQRVKKNMPAFLFLAFLLKEKKNYSIKYDRPVWKLGYSYSKFKLYLHGRKPSVFTFS